MINLVKISDLDVNNKRVLVRLDLDIKEFNYIKFVLLIGSELYNLEESRHSLIYKNVRRDEPAIRCYMMLSCYFNRD